MKQNTLESLIAAYKGASREYRATQYWERYNEPILAELARIDETQLRSGKYPILYTFGFGDVPYYYHPNQVWWKKAVLRLLHKMIGGRDGRPVLPYDLSISDLKKMAYRHCELASAVSGAPPISSIGVSDFGAPTDLFEVGGRQYTIGFLGYYLRYCFAHQFAPLENSHTMVELGSGSGYQVEVLKKLYPALTVFCLDLPLQLHLCETYLSEALGKDQIVSASETLHWKDLSKVTAGKVHFLGNWQIPLFDGYPYELFWNAASFGEMEPDVVKNYLTHVLGNARHIYLCQARHGKESEGVSHVLKPITFNDYGALLPGYHLRGEEDEYRAIRPGSESGGYFQAVWSKKQSA